MVSNQAKNLWVRVAMSEIDPFGSETYQFQVAPSKHVRNSRHNTTSGYPNSLRRSQKLTTNVIGSVNLDWGLRKVPTLGKSKCGGQVNAYSSGASGPSEENDWAMAMCPGVGIGVELGWTVAGCPEGVVWGWDVEKNRFRHMLSPGVVEGGCSRGCCHREGEWNGLRILGNKRLLMIHCWVRVWVVGWEERYIVKLRKWGGEWGCC
jgi:hypothetical protein